MSARRHPKLTGLLDRPRLEAFGDANLLVTFADRLDLEANARAQALAADIRERPEGLGLAIAGHCSVLVPYDPEVLGRADAERAVRRVLDRRAGGVGEAGRARTSEQPVVEIPVRYGGTDGPDLDEVARLHGLTPDEVVALHAAVEYRVLVLGFAPGFAYLGVLDPRLVTPRRATPRTRVPAGSVAIAGEQTAVYPLETPGGWQILGRTELDMWDPRREPPALLRPGQRVRFRPTAA